MIKNQLDKITITDDNELFDKKFNITNAVRDKLEEAYILALSGTKKDIKKLQELVKKFPNHPQFKNYLSVLYERLNQKQKAHQVTELIVQKHPDYFFGLSNMAMIHFINKDYDKIPDILGETFDLQVLYPDRKIFHIDEVIKMNLVAIHYYSSQVDLEKAEERMEILQELCPNGKEFSQAKLLLMSARMTRSVMSLSQLNNTRIDVEELPFTIEQVASPPTFHHSEVQKLYTVDYKIEDRLVEDLLHLPRTTLIEDLESVIQDSLSRYHYHQKNEELDVEPSFLFHALFLLAELQAPESLPTIWKFMRQPDKVISFYLGDILTAHCWSVFFRLEGHSKLPDYLDFMKSPGVNTYVKSEIATAVSQIALHQPERREEVLDWFHGLLSFFNQSKLEDNVVDSELIGLITSYVIDIKGEELLSLIEELYSKEYIGHGVCGDYAEVCKSIKSVNTKKEKRDLLTYKEICQNVSDWNTETEDHDPRGQMLENRFLPFEKTDPKIGRNEPCPCGSGKKHKKCCG